MKKVYFLSTCSNCKEIIKNFSLKNNFELQDIKTNKITNDQMEHMVKLAGSASKLFSKRSRKYPQLGKKIENMEDDEIVKLIMEEYTFLKRPVIIIDQDIFIGSSKSVIERLSKKFQS